MPQLRRIMIEREISGIGDMSIVELCGAARASNQAIAQLSPNVQWQHSYVAGDRTFCVYLAEDRAALARHAELSGLPLTRVVEISQIIDPLTANKLTGRDRSRRAA